MNRNEEHETSYPWVRGAVMSGVGALIGTIAFAVFCYALGLNFTDEGWSENASPTPARRIALIGSLIGFVVAILIFWLGFFQTIRSKS